MNKEIAISSLFAEVEFVKVWVKQSWGLERLSEKLKLNSIKVLTINKRDGSGPILDVLGQCGKQLVNIEVGLGPTDDRHIGQIFTNPVVARAEIAILLCEKALARHVDSVSYFAPGKLDIYIVEMIPTMRNGTIVGMDYNVAYDPTKPSNILISSMQMVESFCLEIKTRVNSETNLFNSSRFNWKQRALIGKGGLSGFQYALVLKRDAVVVRLRISTQGRTQEECKAAFDYLIANRGDIEKNFGETLIWDRLENQKGAKIEFLNPDCNISNCGNSISKIALQIIRFEKSFRQYINDLDWLCS